MSTPEERQLRASLAACGSFEEMVAKATAAVLEQQQPASHYVQFTSLSATNETAQEPSKSRQGVTEQAGAQSSRRSRSAKTAQKVRDSTSLAKPKGNVMKTLEPKLQVPGGHRREVRCRAWSDDRGMLLLRLHSRRLHLPVLLETMPQMCLLCGLKTKNRCSECHEVLCMASAVADDSCFRLFHSSKKLTAAKTKD